MLKVSSSPNLSSKLLSLLLPSSSFGHTTLVACHVFFFPSSVEHVSISSFCLFCFKSCTCTPCPLLFHNQEGRTSSCLHSTWPWNRPQRPCCMSHTGPCEAYRSDWGLHINYDGEKRRCSIREEPSLELLLLLAIMQGAREFELKGRGQRVPERWGT